MRMKSGVCWSLEEEADRLIRESLANVTAHSAKRDILTPWKEKDRRRREVYNHKGVADASLRRGMFSRVANLEAPHLNAVESKVAPMGRTYEHPDHEAGGEYAGDIDLGNFIS